MPSISIDQALQFISLLLAASLLLSSIAGWRQISSARRLPFFRLRQERIAVGWRMLLLAVVLGVLAILNLAFGRQIAYSIIPPTPSITPSPTVTQTPSVTPIPSITATPSITPTASITATSTITSTPQLPPGVSVLFRETVTPKPEAALSPIEIATRLDALNRAVDPSDTFVLPVARLYGAFTYNFLEDGLRWTAVWYRGADVVCLETKPWDGGTGGYGYTECQPDNWLPGAYEIQIFLGEVWRVSARFTILAQTPSPTVVGGTPSAARTPTPTTTPSPPLPSDTRTP